MPNHCENDLRVWGKPADIDAFLAAVKGDGEEKGNPLDFNKIIPYPKELEGTEGFNSGGYEWCVENWGTKWNSYEHTEVLRYKRSAFLGFQTAWSPPRPVIMAASMKFPRLVFQIRYFECGMAYQGVLRVKDGLVLAKADSKYHGSRGG